MIGLIIAILRRLAHDCSWRNALWTHRHVDAKNGFRPMVVACSCGRIFWQASGADGETSRQLLIEIGFLPGKEES